MNSKIIQDIKGAVQDILVQEKGSEKAAVKEANNSEEEEKPAVAAAAETEVGFRVNKTMATVSRLDVGFAQAQPAHCDVEMNKVPYWTQCSGSEIRNRFFPDPRSRMPDP
jgi:hypothetical protein